MNEIKGIPFTWAEFDRNGSAIGDSTLKNTASTTDLFIISHGWKNDSMAAQQLYTSLMGQVADILEKRNGVNPRKYEIFGILWPSKQYEFSKHTAKSSSSNRGGAVSIETADGDPEQEMREMLEQAQLYFNEPEELTTIAELQKLVPDLAAESERAKIDCVTLLRKLSLDDENVDDCTDDGWERFTEGKNLQVFEIASLVPPVAPPIAGTESPAVGFFSEAGDKARNGLANLLNVTTYYKMKKRAGTIGIKGVAPMIDRVAGSTNLERIHLIGHSFGGRLVSAAAMKSSAAKLESLVLLQAAFSHHGFSDRPRGFFRKVVTNDRIRGPIVVTHTHRDKACLLAYAAASRLSGDIANRFGGADDPFGAIGANGVQKFEKERLLTLKMLPKYGVYSFKRGLVHNLDATDIILDEKDPDADAHNHVDKDEVAWMIAEAATVVIANCRNITNPRITFRHGQTNSNNGIE